MGIKKEIKALLTVLLMFTTSNFASASKLPDDVWTYVKGQLPRAVQRFDSVVVINDSVMYVPLYPAARNDVDKVELEYTYPKTNSLKSLPEVFILNNNYVFMKIFKDNKGNFTITKNQNLPEKVKLGVMPQDMLVPVGLSVPENMKIIMGDLIIPKRGDNLLITTSESAVGEEDDVDIVPINELKQTKTFFVNNKSKFVLVYNKGGAEPLYEIKLSGLPSKIVASPLTKFALTMYFGSKTGEIIDLVNERVLTKVEFENMPTDADLDKTTQMAYVTSAKANSIYMVDLNSASLVKTIKSDRAPDKISVSGEDKLLVFSDKINENIYIMNLADGTYSIKKVANVQNLSTLLIGNGRILAVSRTQNKALLYKVQNFENDEAVQLIKELNLAEKPTDAVIYGNRAFILCSKDGIVNVYDFESDKMLEPIKLDESGFYSKISLVPNKSLAVVSGLGTKKVILIDLNNAKLEKKAPANIDVADVVMIDDKPPVKPSAPQENNEEL